MRFFILAVILTNSTLMYGNVEESIDADSVSTNHKSENEGKFAPGEFMLDHILDKHEWHIVTIGKTHVSIPLPIIVYSKISGLHVFMSNKFHHGEEPFEGLRIAESGPNKGKIVETSTVGETVPLDLSITKVVFSLLFVFALTIWVFISIARKYEMNPNKAPSGIQSAIEPMILFVRDDIARPAIGEKKFERFLPYLLTIFFFIWFMNMLGLIPIFPGGANVTGNIAVTMVMAVFTFVITNVSAKKHYWQEIYNAPGVPWWLKFPIPIMPFIEFMGLFIKPIVLMVRLFANIAAGHLMLLAFISLIFIFAQINIFLGYGVSVFSVAFALFMGLLEVLVALIQAYVFTLLSAIYFGMAIAEPHASDHH